MRNLPVLLVLAAIACDSGGSKRDTTPPTVIATVPEHDATGVAPTTTVVITFSEEMDATVTEVVVNVGTANGIWAEGNTVLTVDPPGGGWPTQSRHVIEVPVTFSDAAGNPLAQAHTFSFETEVGDPCAMDSEAPNVISDLNPPPVDIGTDTYRLAFDEAVVLSVGDLTIDGGASIAGLVPVNPRTFDVQLADLVAAATHQLVVASAVTDSCGNSLAGAVTISLAVHNPCVIDVVGPEVTSTTSPVPVPPGSTVYQLRFDEDVMPLTSDDIGLNGLAGVGAGVIDSLVAVDGSSYDIALSGLTDGDAYLLEVYTSVADVCGNPLSAQVSVALLIVDPCTADNVPPELDSSEEAEVAPPVDTYRAVFNEPMGAVTVAHIGLSPLVGSGTVSTVTAVDTRTFDIEIIGLAHGDHYTLAILDIVEDICGNRPAAHTFVDIEVVDPCATDSNPPAVTSPPSVNRVPGTGFYRLTFDEDVALGAGDLTLSATGGPGAGGITSVDEVSASSYDVHLAGLAATDTYQLAIAATVADACGNAIGPSQSVAITVMAPPAPGLCTADHVEIETFALSMTAPPPAWAGNTNGVGGSAEPWDTGSAEVTGMMGNMATDTSFIVGGLVEQFDPASINTISRASDTFALGTWSGLAGREVEIGVAMDGADSSTTWGATGAGFIEVVLVDGSGMVVGPRILATIDTVGGTVATSERWDTLTLVEGETYFLVVTARPDAAPATVGEHLDYCVTIASRPFSPPAGGQCSTSVDLSGQAMPVVFSETFANTGADGGSCDPTVDNGVWFNFQPTSTEEYLVIVSNSAGGSWSRLAVFEGDCDILARTEVDCIAVERPEVETKLAMTSGVPYYFAFYTDGTAFPMETPAVSIEPCSGVVVTAVGLSPPHGAVDVLTSANLEVTFDGAVATDLGVVTVSGDGGTNASYDFALGLGTLSVELEQGNTVMRLDPPTGFALGEHITVSWDSDFTEPVCGVNPVAMSTPWEFDVIAVGWTDLIDARFDDASAMVAWTTTGGTSCNGPSQWVHNSDSTTAGCSDTTSDFGGLTDGNFAVANSDCCGSGGSLDTEMMSSTLDCSTFAVVEFYYDVGYVHYGSSEMTVDVSIGGGAWQPVASYTSDTAVSAMHDLSTMAAGQSDVRIRFHYVAGWDYYAMIDNVLVRGQ